MWTNYHTHSTWCDGKKSVPDVIAKAEALKMAAIGLSSHAPLPFPRSWCMKEENLDAYLSQIRTLKQTHRYPEIYSGLEIDYIPQKISPLQFKNRLDYTIGSIHFVDAFPNGDGWEIDGTYQLFRDGLTQIFHNDIRAAITRYFDLTREMVLNAPPDIIGHIDKIKIQNRDGLFSETESWYRDAVTKTLDVVQQEGCIVEVNTRGIYQKKSHTTYPGPWILNEIHQRSIPITLSSDAHHPDDLVNQFTYVAGELLHIGFKKIRILLDGRWQDVAFDNEGIKRGQSHYPLA